MEILGLRRRGSRFFPFNGLGDFQRVAVGLADTVLPDAPAVG